MKTHSNYHTTKNALNLPTSEYSHRDRNHSKPRSIPYITQPNFYTPKYDHKPLLNNIDYTYNTNNTNNNNIQSSYRTAYNNLTTENISNKMILDTITGIDPSEKLFKKEMKILQDNPSLNEANSHKLQETHKIIKLKLLCQDYKKQLEIKDTQIEELKQKEKTQYTIELETIVNETQNELRKVTNAYEKLIHKFNCVSTQLNDMNDNVEYYKNVCKHKDNEIEMLKKENDVLKNDNTELHKIVGNNGKVLKKKNEKIQEWDKKIKELEKEIENYKEKENELNEYEKNKEQINHKELVIKNKLNVVMLDKKKLEKENKNLMQVNDEKCQEVDKLKKENEKLLGKIKKLQKQINAVKHKNDIEKDEDNNTNTKAVVVNEHENKELKEQINTNNNIDDNTNNKKENDIDDEDTVEQKSITE